MSGNTSESIKWHIRQVKGENTGDASNADVFSCLEFDESGDYLAAGDKSGRIFIFNSSGQPKNVTYNIYCAFTSHELEFDYLKSLEIEENINTICWLPSVNNALHLLSTNDKVIKLWRMSVKNPEAYNFNTRSEDDPDGNNSDANSTPGTSSINVSVSSLRIPRYRETSKLTIEVRPRRVYADAHMYHINSISVNSDQETFLSADDLRINLWHIDVSNQSFSEFKVSFYGLFVGLYTYLIVTSKGCYTLNTTISAVPLKMSGNTSESIKWHISQVKGDNTGDASNADVFSCLEFDESGDYLAAGDKSGRIFIFNSSGQPKNVTYNIYCAFTSHELEFDYLKSLEIEEKINAICWLPSVNNALHLLSTNDKVIKLWRMSVKNPEAYNFNTRSEDDPDGNNSDANSTPGTSSLNASVSSLRIPRYRETSKLTIEVRPRRVYADAHMYHINSISVNSDQETFLSADDLRINLWHIDVSNQSFTIVDLKPPNMEELSEVITCSRFHQKHCNMLGYSTSRGIVRLCDMRLRALCDNHVLVLDDPSLSQNRGFFADIIASLSDFRFDHSGNYILARDYLNLKVWDIRKSDQPCEVYSVHEPLRSQLCMLYETDGIFDKFLCSWSEDDRYLLTGSYGNVLRVFDRIDGTDWIYDLGETGLRPSFPFTSSTAKSMTTPSLRPQRTRIQPKRFIFPDSDLGSRLGVSSVCLAHATSVDTIDPPQQPSPVDVHPVSPAAGSKRRKQVFNDRKTPTNTIPLSPSSVSSDDDDDWDEEEEESNDQTNGEDVLVTGLRQLDFTRKFLQVAWHPQRKMVVSTCGNQMFLCQGKQLPLPLIEDKLVLGDDSTTEELHHEQSLPTGLISSPLDNIKSAKRRRWREKHKISIRPTLTYFQEDEIAIELKVSADPLSPHSPPKCTPLVSTVEKNSNKQNSTRTAPLATFSDETDCVGPLEIGMDALLPEINTPTEDAIIMDVE